MEYLKATFHLSPNPQFFLKGPQSRLKWRTFERYMIEMSNRGIWFVLAKLGGQGTVYMLNFWLNARCCRKYWSFGYKIGKFWCKIIENGINTYVKAYDLFFSSLPCSDVFLLDVIAFEIF